MRGHERDSRVHLRRNVGVGRPLHPWRRQGWGESRGGEPPLAREAERSGAVGLCYAKCHIWYGTLQFRHTTRRSQIPSKGHEMPKRGIGLRRINTAHPYMKGGSIMASVTKFDRTAIVNQLRHIERQIRNSSNPDIDRDRSDDNYP